MDQFIQRMRQARTQSVVSSLNLPGRDINHAIDAFIDVIAHYEGRDRADAAWYMAMGIGMTPTEPLSDPRRLDFMLPARVAPVLAAALREEPRGARYHLTQLLGSVDEPTQEVIDTLRALLLSNDPDAQDDAARGIAMLGRHAADLAPDLERLLAEVNAVAEPDHAQPHLARRVRVAGALARVSDAPRPEALDVVIEGLDGASGYAVTELKHLGERALPAVPHLLARLPKEQNDIGDIVEAVLYASPDAFPDLLTILVDMTVVTDERVQAAIDADLREWLATRQNLTEEQRRRFEEQRRAQEQKHPQTEQEMTRRAGIADGVLSAIFPALAWAQTPQDSRGPMPRGLHAIAGPLARISDEALAAAANALVEIADGPDPDAAARATQCLADMGSMASPALDGLLAVYRRGDASGPSVSHAILAISPAMAADLLPAVLARAISDDAAVAASARGELSALVANTGVKWEDTPDLRAITPDLIQALAERPASEGKALARALRRIDTPEARKAYREHTRRQLKEKSRRR